LVVTDLIFKEGITDVLCNSRHSLDIVLRFIIALGGDAMV